MTWVKRRRFAAAPTRRHALRRHAPTQKSATRDARAVRCGAALRGAPSSSCRDNFARIALTCINGRAPSPLRLESNLRSRYAPC
ncbi:MULTISPECIES: hypothetical protein [Burkholderia]|uniref:hypothetical protein n=1 Tax=Burkholderia TaxID=32008 RepID=UPI0012E3BCF4|nr:MULTISPECIES: hypothetical protein [Burkholderia]